MISSFSSLIELFAAIYLTISLDDLLLRRFWTPDYAQKLELGFNKIKMPDLAKRPTIERTKNYSSYEEKRSRKRGGLMFGFTVLLLIIVGFEKYFSPLGELGQSVLLALLCFAELIAYLFDQTFLKSWWSVLWTTTLIPLVIIVIGLTIININEYEVFVQFEHRWMAFAARILVILSLILPVIWQLVRNWIYTCYYLLYIVDQTSIKAKEYHGALRYDHAKGDRINEVAMAYHDAVVGAVVAGAGDRQITPFLNVLQNELKKIEFVPTLIPLLRYSYQSYKKSHPSNRTLKRMYKKYHSLSRLPRMEQFCDNEKINYEVFKEYHRKQIGR